MSETEIIFEVNEDEVESGYTASALGYGIHTEGDSLEELRPQRQRGRRVLLRRYYAAPQVDSVALRT